MNSEPYLIPASDVVVEEEIKKSRFITHIAHTPTVESAKQFVQQIKSQHKEARHNCWAFVAGRPEDSMLWGCSDDGEPSGTAGKPMLAQLTGSGVGELAAVVTRYSGGIKLGTGGLVKAYGGGVQQALAQLETQEKVLTETIHLQCEYSQLSLVEKLVSDVLGEQANAVYGDNVAMDVIVDRRKVEQLIDQLINRSGGQIQPQRPTLDK